MDPYASSYGLSPQVHFFPPVAGSNLNGTLSSQYGWQPAGSDVDGFRVNMPEPSKYKYPRPTGYNVSAQEEPTYSEVLAPRARRLANKDLNYFLNFDESQPASPDVASFLSASPSPSQQSDHGLKYNVPLSHYHGPWNGTQSDRHFRRRLVQPIVSEHVLTYHQPSNTIGLDSIGATIWSKDTPGPMCSPTDLAGLSGVPLSSPSSTVDLNKMYDLRYPPQLTAQSRLVSPMTEAASWPRPSLDRVSALGYPSLITAASRPVSPMQGEASGVHRSPRPTRPDTKGIPERYRWPFSADVRDEPSPLTPLELLGPGLLRGRSMSRIPQIHSPSPTPRLSTSASVYPDPRQSFTANHDYEPGVATGYYPDPKSGDERYEGLVNIPDPETNIHRPWRDKGSTFFSAMRAGGGSLASLAWRTAKGAKDVFKLFPEDE